MDTYTAQPSNSSDNPLEEPKQYSDVVRFTALIIGIPIIMVGFFGNALTIAAVIKTKSLRTGANIFIIGLSTFDLTYTCVVVPTVITVHWRNSWVFSKIYCHIFPVVFILAVGESLMSLSGTAVCRYLKIMRPKIFALIFSRKCYVAALLCGFWLTPVLCIMPPIVGIWGQLGYEPRTLTCTFLRDDSGYNTFLMLTAFMTPITFISFCYLRILCKVCSNRRKIQAARQTSTSGDQSVQKSQQREDLRYTRMMVAIFVVFLMAYTPYIVNNLLDPYVENMDRGFFCATCAWLSPCLNPVIYALLNRHFRRAFLTILPCCNPDTVEESVHKSAWWGENQHLLCNGLVQTTKVSQKIEKL